GETIHSRSAMLSSERLGVVAKMDLIEVKMAGRSEGDLFGRYEAQSVTPVDYKVGAPRRGSEGNELWDADRMQLGLQILILRDNGYACDEGVIYYRATKQRVRLIMTSEIERWIVGKIEEARALTLSPEIPPPLVNSPKCVRCSLAPVCLPDETRMLGRDSAWESRRGAATEASGSMRQASNEAPRRLIATRDEERALYLNTQGYRVGVKSERLIIKDGESLVDEVRLIDVSHVALFGNVQISTQAVRELCEQEIPVAYFSLGGWFYGLTRGHGLKNVHTRIQQFTAAGNPVRCLEVAQSIVRAKIRNHRTMLMRLHTEAPTPVIVGLKEIAARVSDARGLDELLGMEGSAAALYFQQFAGLIKVGGDEEDDEIPGLESMPEADARRRAAAAKEFTFDFTRRRRRPPTDPVNALLSLSYSLLAKDCTIAAFAVGFDPYVGFYHQPRHGRPALALDLMEEFRPLVAESAVLTAINNRMITPSHFVCAGNAVNLSPIGRKAFFHAYEQRMNSLITHPIFDYKVSYRRVIELQARLLAKWLTGEIPEYVPMTT
ncbi:MAG: CRISPR-associated endonuclease Cas1, partial [Verrucomicrobiae bacterium]|nr:CRISPR-associated endonuclease Cas1 [Verrucomicrobiae bacterium]